MFLTAESKYFMRTFRKLNFAAFWTVVHAPWTSVVLVLEGGLSLGKASGQLWNSRDFWVKEGINLDFGLCCSRFSGHLIDEGACQQRSSESESVSGEALD